MKLGPFWRKRHSNLHQLLKKFSGFLDYGLWLLFDPSKFKRIKTKEINKILILLIHKGPGNVGGNFAILGVTSYFKEIYPNVKIVFLLDKDAKKQFGKVPGIEMVENKGQKTIKKLKKENFKAVLLFDPGEYKVKDFLDVPYRLRYAATSIGELLDSEYKLFITRKVFIPWGRMHIVEFIFKKYESMGFRFPSKKLKFCYNKKENEKIKGFLRKHKIKNFIVFNPGGKGVVDALKNKKWPPHLWPLDRYAKVADYLTKKGFTVLIIGAPNESILAEEIDRASGYGVINCTKKFTIRETGALLEKAQAFVSTDNGSVHVAYQVGTPILELFGPSQQKVAGAWPLNSTKHKFLFDHGPCEHSDKKQECPEDIICLGQISVSKVIAAIEELLKIKK